MNATSVVMTFDLLKEKVNNAIAVRSCRRLQPADGKGGKIFPSTYPHPKEKNKGTYLNEQRIINGERIECVIIDSVQSQANRIEQALKNTYFVPNTKTCAIPVIDVNFAKAELPEVGHITSLDAPHRIADAILRDSEYNGKKFRDSDAGKSLTEASAANATAIFKYCPLALLLGIWDSTGPKGGLGMKVQRSLISELVAINAVIGKKSSIRIDPLNISSSIDIKGDADNWELATTSTSSKTDKKAQSYIKPSAINHSNVPTPIDVDTGGVTCDYIQQTSVISLAGLRKIQFPVENGKYANNEARTVLAALGICGVLLAQNDCDLRSRCVLVPENPANWEIIDADGKITSLTITAAEAQDLLALAIKNAKDVGLPWETEVMTLTPSKKLAELVKFSRDKQAASKEQATED